MRAHPRSRGENLIPTVMQLSSVGSSPLTRGKRLASRVCIVIRGLIPAHAGKTTPLRPVPGGTTAHPRSRGENYTCAVCVRGSGGSSPLTRGKLLVEHTYTIWARLIPAHAGKTRRSQIADLVPEAHPRSRGENGDRVGHCLAFRGSSPLTRGKRDTSVFVTQVIRLIPAHAGKTGRRESIIWLARAHPRSRGEN